MNISNTFLKSIFCNDLTNEIPDLISFICSQQDKSTRIINMEEIHTIYNEILFGELEIIIFLSFVLLLCLSWNQTEGKFTFLRTFLSDIVKSKEATITWKIYFILEIIFNLAYFINFQRFVFEGKFIKRCNKSYIDSSFSALIFAHYTEPIIMPIPINMYNFIFYLKATYLKWIFFSNEICYLNCSSKMILFDELFKWNSNPITSLWNKNLSISSVFTPSTPFFLLSCLNIIKEYLCCWYINGIIINFIAHNNNPCVSFDPWYFLGMRSFNDILFFFWEFQLALKFLNIGDVVNSNFIQ